MLKKIIALILACVISLVLILSIPILHLLFNSSLKEEKTNVLKISRVETFKQKTKKKKKIKILKQIKPKRISRKSKYKPSRFKIDLSSAGSSDGAVVEKDELKIEAYEMGQTDTPPVPRKQVYPRMPIRAQEEQIQGVVVVRFLVDERGEVILPKIVKEEPLGYGFGSEALKTVNKYEFEPAKLRGVAVKTWVVQEIDFVLKKDR